MSVVSGRRPVNLVQEIQSNRAMINYPKLYENLGYFFYGIAARFTTIRKKEKDVLIQLVESHWLPFVKQNEDLDAGATTYLLNCFDYLSSQNASASACLNIFHSYYELNQESLNSDLKNQILNSANVIETQFKCM